MNLYKIEQQIADILSQVNDDGMLTDEAMDKLEQLQMDETKKLENVACYIKDLIAESKAIRDEEKALADRRKSKENKAERLKNYLSDYLVSKGMSKYETARAVLSFRKSKAVAIGDEAELLTYLKANYVDLVKVAESVDKTGLKTLLESGHEIPHAIIEERQNIQVK